MRVDDRIGTETAARQSAAAAQVEQAGRGGAARGQRAGGADSLDLSPLAARIRQAFDAMAAAHGERVARVGAEVAAGRYQTDIGRLSRALAAEALGEAGL